MYIITHRVFTADLCTELDLKKLCRDNVNTMLYKVPFKVLRWQHRRIAGSVQVYRTGRIIFHGLSKKDLRRYARIMQRQGHSVRLKCVKNVTTSAVYNLRKNVCYGNICKHLDGSYYEPEIFHALKIRKGKLHFIIYKTGKIIITGINMYNDASVLETLLNLEVV